jgi:hypothetical protein
VPFLRIGGKPMSAAQIKSLREQAASCRNFAQHSNTPTVRNEFLERAREFDEEADRLEAKDKGAADNL